MSFINKSDCQILYKDKLENEDNDLKYRSVNPHPFIPVDSKNRKATCKEIISIQAAGLVKRLEHIGSEGFIVGVSGGLDSTLAL